MYSQWERWLCEFMLHHPPLPIESLMHKLGSPHSQRTYQRAIKDYLAFIERDPFQVTPAAVQSYVRWLAARYPSVVAALHLRIVHDLYQEAVEQGLLPANPAAHVAPPSPPPIPGCPVPSREAAAARLETCRRHTLRGQRDYAMFSLLVNAGVESEEVPGLKVGDYRCEQGSCAIWLRRGPGQSPTRVGLPDDARSALDQYLGACQVADDSPLFGQPQPPVVR